MLIVCHNRKADAAFADDTTLGSRGFVGIARGVLHLRTDPDDPMKQRRVLAAGGTNLGATAAALAFRITGQPASLEWEPEPLTGFHADDLMKPPTDRPRGPHPEKRTAAANWLAGLLRNGPKPVGEIKEQAKAAEVSWRTVKRAQEDLGITPHKPGYAGGWVWSLPVEGGQPAPGSVPREEHPGTLRENQGESPRTEAENLEGCQVDDTLAPFAERGEDLPTFAAPCTLAPAPSVEGSREEPVAVWNDLDGYSDLLKRTGRAWGDEVRWLNTEHDARLPKGPPFSTVPAELRRLSAEHLSRLPAIPRRPTL